MIFDTDVLIWFLRGNPKAMREIEQASPRTVSIVSVMELYQGARSRQEIRQIAGFLQAYEFRIAPLTETIGERALALIEDHAMRDGLQVADALIAATTLQAREALVTGNSRHFRRIPKLEVRAFRVTT